MKLNHQLHKRMQNTVTVSKKIQGTLKKLNHLEKNNDKKSDFFNKFLLLFEELIKHEKNLCQKLSETPGYEEMFYEIMESPQRFQAKYGLNPQSFSRLFRNFFIYDQNRAADLNINVLNLIPEFSHIEFKLNDNSPQLFKAFSEDLFKVYLKMLNKNIEKINNPEVKEELIDEKYKIFATYANTNEFFVDNTRDEKTPIISKSATLIEEHNIDNRVYDYLLADFTHHFCQEFFERTLTIDQEYLKQHEKEKIIRLTLLDSVLVFADKEIRSMVENLFYKKYYQIDQTKKINPKMADTILTKIKIKEENPKTITI